MPRKPPAPALARSSSPPVIDVKSTAPNKPAPLNTEDSFPKFAALHYRKARMSMLIATVVGVLAAIALSWMKPLLGYIGIVGIVLGVATIAVGTLIVYVIQLWYAYNVAHTHSVARKVRSYPALIVSVAVISLIPLVAMCVAELLGPDYGIARSVVTACGVNVSLDVTRSSTSSGGNSGSGGWFSSFSGSSSGGGRSAEAAKKHLLTTAQRMGDHNNVSAFIEAIEEDRTNSWSAADSMFFTPDFTPETIQAYKEYRAAKIASGFQITERNR